MPAPGDVPRQGVLMLTKGLGRGGAERLLTGLVRHLDRTRFRVEIAYLLPWKDAHVEEIEAEGVTVHCLDGAGLKGAAWPARLRRLVRERDISLIHTHNPLPAAWARLALPRAGAPSFVHTEHNLWSRYRTLTRWSNAVTYRRNSRAIAVSKEVASQIRSRVPVETVVHGIDWEMLAAQAGRDRAPERAREKLGLPEGAPVIATVGNFTAKKDHPTLLRAFVKVRSSHPEARLVLVGLGPMETKLRRLAGELGIDDAVLFTGMRDDVYELLPGFDLFVMSSRYEGLPIALLEAMACEVAPVTTAVGGIPEVLTDGENGLLVDPGEDAQLAGAIDRLLANDAERSRLGEQARQRARDFDIERAVQRIAGIYDDVLGTGLARAGKSIGLHDQTA